MLADFDVRVRDLALGLALILSVVEVAWPGRRVIGYCLGPKKMLAHFCYVAELPTLKSLLRGPDKRMRHTRINVPEVLAGPAPRRLLEIASTHRMPAKSSSREE